MSKAAHRIFLRFYMKPECLKGQKLSQPSFRKSPKILAEKGCFGSCQKFNPLVWCTFLPQKIVHTNFLYDSVKTTCLGKSCFFSYGLNYSQPFRLPYSLIIDMCGRNQTIPYLYLTIPRFFAGR